MNLPSLSADEFLDPQAWAVWNLDHTIVHQELQDATLRAGKSAELYPLDPDQMQDWLRRHQIMHEQLVQAWAIPGEAYNLEDWDLDEQQQLQDWIAIHAADHLRIANAAGVS